jgi:sulfite exporter TauE/SafE
MELIAAITLGILGSFHCLGMCGPIALALPVHHQRPIKKFLSVLLYNLGRATTYSAFGFLFGLLGQGFFVGGFQQTLSVSIGTIILISVIYSMLFSKGLFKMNAINGFVLKLKSKFGDLFRVRSTSALFLIGLLNGLLPCGLVYVAIAGATATGHFLNGALFMFVFGLGTIPMMLSLSMFGQFMQVKYRNLVRKTVPVFVSAMAILMILRGLNLGIPYISPKIVETENAKMDCHSPGSEQTMECCSKPGINEEGK